MKEHTPMLHLSENELPLLTGEEPIDTTIQAVTIQQLIELRAQEMPEQVALVMGAQSLSYRELNERANRIANYLRTQGVERETLVGICLERSIDFVIGLLAILKAGGAYLPLDPAYPVERLTFMLSDSQTAFILSEQRFADRLLQCEARVLHLDSERALFEQQSLENPSARNQLSDLVYVIYTSGSTGQPKGVEVTHGGLLNLILWHQDAFAISAADRATQVASPAFDATGWEIWPYLIKGATLFIPDEQIRVTPHLLRDWLVEQRITVSFMPTLLAESLLGLAWPAETALRFLLTGADTLHHYPTTELPFALINNYGPTEATVVTTSGRVLPTAQPDRAPSIGTPISNVQVYLLDEQRQSVPMGEVGELYIGGAGLARGYLNRPELTAERFVANPLSTEKEARLYRTGDLARFLPDGQIAFLGRTDHQVKIRGYRIELDEITSALQSHPHVQTCAVIAREDVPGDKHLVGYIVATADLTLRSLQEHLLQQLPDYMLPTAFIVLDAFPLTAHGKLDRAALPAPDEYNTLRDEQMALPSNPIEQQVSEIVCTLLHLPTVSIDDNFFLLGGHSLLGTQIIARVSATFNVDLSLRALFESPTVRELSAQIEALMLSAIESMDADEVARLLEQA